MSDYRQRWSFDRVFDRAVSAYAGGALHIHSRVLRLLRLTRRGIGLTLVDLRHLLGALLDRRLDCLCGVDLRNIHQDTRNDLFGRIDARSVGT
jgi:hypothetical protein